MTVLRIHSVCAVAYRRIESSKRLQLMGPWDSNSFREPQCGDSTSVTDPEMFDFGESPMPGEWKDHLKKKLGERLRYFLYMNGTGSLPGE